jgi:hypothetical protein
MRIRDEQRLDLPVDYYRKPRLRMYGLERAKQRGRENDIPEGIQPEHDVREWRPL